MNISLWIICFLGLFIVEFYDLFPNCIDSLDVSEKRKKERKNVTHGKHVTISVFSSPFDSQVAGNDILEMMPQTDRESKRVCLEQISK